MEKSNKNKINKLKSFKIASLIKMKKLYKHIKRNNFKYVYKYL